jgi:hypothetical protein
VLVKSGSNPSAGIALPLEHFLIFVFCPGSTPPLRFLDLPDPWITSRDLVGSSEGRGAWRCRFKPVQIPFPVKWTALPLEHFFVFVFSFRKLAWMDRHWALKHPKGPRGTHPAARGPRGARRFSSCAGNLQGTALPLEHVLIFVGTALPLEHFLIFVGTALPLEHV